MKLSSCAWREFTALGPAGRASVVSVRGSPALLRPPSATTKATPISACCASPAASASATRASTSGRASPCFSLSAGGAAPVPRGLASCWSTSGAVLPARRARFRGEASTSLDSGKEQLQACSTARSTSSRERLVAAGQKLGPEAPSARRGVRHDPCSERHVVSGSDPSHAEKARAFR